MRKVDHSVIYDPSLQIWLSVQGDMGSIGLTDWGQKAVGDIQAIIIDKRIGESVIQNGLLLEVESDKALTEIIAPVSGTLIEVNKIVLDNPSIVNKAPYLPNWIVKIKLADSSHLDHFIEVGEYKESIDSFFRKS